MAREWRRGIWDGVRVVPRDESRNGLRVEAKDEGWVEGGGKG